MLRRMPTPMMLMSIVLVVAGLCPRGTQRVLTVGRWSIYFAQPLTTPPPVLGQDVDGDGIADAGLVFLPPPLSHSFAGFGWGTWGITVYAGGIRIPFDEHLSLVVPSWPLSVLGLILPARRFTNFILRRYRARHSRCRQCGYDLRGGHARCPECGLPLSFCNRPVSPFPFVA